MTALYQYTLGTGKPLVLVHGWAMHSGIWHAFAEQLAQSYQVTCIDLPGHGRSAAVEQFTLAHISEALVNAVAEPHSCWLGWSLGALVVLDLAQRYPERVNGLILMAGNPHFTETLDWHGLAPQLLNAFAEQLTTDCQATLLRFLALQVSGLADAKSLLTTLKAAVFATKTPDANTLRGGLDILKHADLRSALTTLTCPITTILGQRDTLVPAAVGVQLQQLVPTMPCHLLDKAGHVPFLSHPQDVLAIMSSFMDTLCFNSHSTSSAE